MMFEADGVDEELVWWGRAINLYSRTFRAILADQSRALP